MLQRHCLNQKELARRWGISHRTLERWRYNGQGPTFLKLGGRVLYRLADIEAFEQSQLQRALKISEAVARVGHAPRRLTADGEILEEAIGLEPARWTRGDQMRVSAYLKANGWERYRRRDEGGREALREWRYRRGQK